ncbi:recombinase family protein [Levilactobacillus brevis]|uniref:recombinase family protein n=1 Tax=Levilactobacillus brevis TaxID=1580 RepID=UPI0022E79DB3|nr:recombinase family protein [Levilactobacillus brevis]
MAKIGYARVSSKEQHLDRQLAALKGVDKLFSDKLSGANTKRPELQKMLAYIREGDIVLLIIELYKYQAESERKRIIERQQQGIALAKQQGKYHGRKPQYTQDDPRLQHAFKLYRAGMSDIDVSRNTGIKRTTFIRYRVKYGIKRK